MKTVTDDMDRTALFRLWDRCFLNYTTDAPDRWIDPEQEYAGFFDDPCIAVPILIKLNDRDRQQAYVEYFAAVWRQHFARQNDCLEAALPLLEMAAGQWLDRADDLNRLLLAVKGRLGLTPQSDQGGLRQR